MTLRHEFAIVFAVMIAMLSLLQHIPVVPLFHKIEVEQIPRYEAAMQPLRKILTTTRVIGYTSDFPPGESQEAYFILAQYSLAPLLVEHSPDHETIIGFFMNKDNLNEFCQANKTRIVHESPVGLYLLEKIR